MSSRWSWCFLGRSNYRFLAVGERFHDSSVGPARHRQNLRDDWPNHCRFYVGRSHDPRRDRSFRVCTQSSSQRQDHPPRILLGFSTRSSYGEATTRLVLRVCRNGPDQQHAEGSAAQLRLCSGKAHAAKDARAVQRLESIGPPPFDSLDKIGTFFQTLGKYECEPDRNPGASVLTAPNYSLWDIYNLVRGFAVVPTFAVYHEMLSADLLSLGRDFRIPVFLFQGELDERTQAANSVKQVQRSQGSSDAANSAVATLSDHTPFVSVTIALK